MNKNFEHSEEEEEENLKNENEFLKMKLMLEQGAKFGSMQTGGNLPPEIENQFLKNIMAFEKQAAEQKTIKVFDKIKRPGQFKPVNEILDDAIENAWNELDNYLRNYNIELSVCSPNVSDRELYRFTTEELFNHEMIDMNVPGMMSCFTYDEFHPDHKYDNTRTATDDCIEIIFKKQPVEWMPHLRNENLRINDHYPLSEENFKEIINRFKEVYEDIKVNEIKDVDCTIDEKTCQVKGAYNITMVLPLEEIVLQGNWMVEFELDEDFGYWDIVNVQVEGIRF